MSAGTQVMGVIKEDCEGGCNRLAEPGELFCNSCAKLNRMFEQRRADMEAKRLIYGLDREPVLALRRNAGVGQAAPRRLFSGWTAGERAVFFLICVGSVGGGACMVAAGLYGLRWALGILMGGGRP